MVKIIPEERVQSHKTGHLLGVTAEQINEALGFKPNVDDDPGKVVNSWGFQADGELCAIWDYKGSYMFDSYSTFGPSEVFDRLFPGKWSKR